MSFIAWHAQMDSRIPNAGFDIVFIIARGFKRDFGFDDCEESQMTNWGRRSRRRACSGAARDSIGAIQDLRYKSAKAALVCPGGLRRDHAVELASGPVRRAPLRGNHRTLRNRYDERRNARTAGYLNGGRDGHAHGVSAPKPARQGIRSPPPHFED
jgi:hypothetical protein